jgi:hypothetical protein
LLKSHDNETVTLLFSVLDSDNVSVEAFLERQDSTPGTVSICERVVVNDSWQSCSIEVDQDFFPLSPGGNWTAVVIAQDMNSSWWASPGLTEFESESFEIRLPVPTSQPHASFLGRFFGAGL